MIKLTIGLTFAALMNAATFPQIVDGGGWTTIFTIHNPRTTAVNASFLFLDSNGRPWPIRLTKNGFVMASADFSGQLTIPIAARSVETWYTTNTSSTSLATGSAITTGSGTISVVVRQTVPGRPEAEGAAHLATCGKRLAVPFDFGGGFSTGVALVNAQPRPIRILGTIYRSDGSYVQETEFTLASRQQISFAIADRYVGAADIQGSLELVVTPEASALTQSLCGMALQFNPRGTFTTLPVTGVE